MIQTFVQQTAFFILLSSKALCYELNTEFTEDILQQVLVVEREIFKKYFIRKIAFFMKNSLLYFQLLFQVSFGFCGRKCSKTV